MNLANKKGFIIKHRKQIHRSSQNNKAPSQGLFYLNLFAVSIGAYI